MPKIKTPLIRPRYGNLTVLVIVVGALIMLVLFFFLYRVSIVQITEHIHHNAAEAASLAAARDLSKIVVNDPHFGYVGLSDYPPASKATLALDGEPLPVLSINTILGIIRLEMLVAEKLDNQELQVLAEQDFKAAHHTCKLLSNALNAAIDPNSSSKAKDNSGMPVKAYESAKQAYLANGGHLENKDAPKSPDFCLSLGWLKTGSETVTWAPFPAAQAKLSKNALQNNCYKAFIDIPVAKHSFYFAGLGKQPSLVDPHQFMEPDGKRFCSIVKIQTKLKLDNKHDKQQTDSTAKVRTTTDPNLMLTTSACAQPAADDEATPPGVLTIGIADGVPSGINSLHDILNHPQLNQRFARILTAQGGDYPKDKGSTLVPGSIDAHNGSLTVAQVFAQCFYDWLRTAHCKVNIDSLLEAVDHPFNASGLNILGNNYRTTLMYELDRSGNIVITSCKRNPFIAQTVHENQIYAISDQPLVAGGKSWHIACRDQVRLLGTAAGGKHAGQPMPGNPVNWCELAYFDKSSEKASELGKGGEALGLKVTGTSRGCAGGREAISLNSAHFEERHGKELPQQPRKSYYSGGLAAQLQFLGQ